MPFHEAALAATDIKWYDALTASDKSTSLLRHERFGVALLDEADGVTCATVRVRARLLPGFELEVDATAGQENWLGSDCACLLVSRPVAATSGVLREVPRAAVGSSSAEDANAARTGRGALHLAARGDPAPPVASSYLLTIMVPEFRTKLGSRQLRELKILCRALDLVAEGEAWRAADILAQRVKAVEAGLHDDNWLKAQFVELLPREGSLLLETDEAVMAARQLALEFF
eukprot:s312_g13.t1